MQVDLRKLKRLRKQHNLSIKDVSQALGYKSANAYHCLESGRIKMKAEHLKKLATMFGVSLENLFVGGTKTIVGNIEKLSDQKLMEMFKQAQKKRVREDEQEVVYLLSFELRKRGLMGKVIENDWD